MLLFFRKENKSTSPKCLLIRDLTKNPLKVCGLEYGQLLNKTNSISCFCCFDWEMVLQCCCAYFRKSGVFIVVFLNWRFVVI